MASIIVTGATGTAGSAVLAEALASPLIKHVTVLARRAPEVKSDKLSTVILPSDTDGRFDELKPALLDKLRGHSAVVWALGVSQRDVTTAQYEQITYDYTVEAGRALAPLGSTSEPFRFVFVSGMGADQSGKGWALFSKVKGRAEAHLASLESQSFTVANLRPGGIIPSAAHAQNVSWGRHTFLAALQWVIPGRMIHATDLAKAAVGLAVSSSDKGWAERDPKEKWIENDVLNKLATDYSQLVH